MTDWHAGVEPDASSARQQRPGKQPSPHCQFEYKG